MIAWLQTRLQSGWVEVEARPGQPVQALHRPTLENQAPRLPSAADLLPLLEHGEAIVRAVIEGHPAPTWLVERHRRRTHVTDLRR